MIRFTIKGTLAGLNEYTRACRGNKYGGAQLKKKQQDAVCKAIISTYMSDGISNVNNYPCELKITWYEPNMKRDVDNITFATKFILDAMVEMHLIKDDSQKYVSGIRHEVITDKHNPRIEVTIDEPR